MKQKLSNFTAVIALLSFTCIILAIVLKSQNAALIGGGSLILSITFNTVINSIKTFKS